MCPQVTLAHGVPLPCPWTMPPCHACKLSAFDGCQRTCLAAQTICGAISRKPAISFRARRSRCTVSAVTLHRLGRMRCVTLHFPHLQTLHAGRSCSQLQPTFMLFGLLVFVLPGCQLHGASEHQSMSPRQKTACLLPPCRRSLPSSRVGTQLEQRGLRPK